MAKRKQAGKSYLKTKGGRQGFCAGIREGERRTQRLINCLSKGNHNLLELVNLIDVKYPIAGVTISFAMAERIISGLKSPGACTRLAHELQGIVNDCNCELGMDLARVENEMKELIG